jgi:hypothetical protein
MSTLNDVFPAHESPLVQEGPEGTLYLVMYSDPESDQRMVVGSHVSAPVWVVIGPFRGATRRKAVEAAMLSEGLDVGDFMAIPQSSAEVMSPRVTKKIAW